MLFLKNKCLVKTFCESTTKNLEKDFIKLDFYSILNVKKTATEKEIRISYFNLAKKFHPDKFKGPAEIFKKISDAYNTLKDPHKREEYNRIMRFKMKKKFREHAEENKKKENKMQDYSKYEEEFKKINIDKLFYQFTKSKIRTNADEICVFKPALEKKMSKREYQIHLFLKTLREEQIKNKSVSYAFYKKLGMVKDELKTEKTYEELAKDEVDKFKNKQKIEEEMKMKEKEEKEQEDIENLRMRRMLYHLIAVYLAVLAIILYKKYDNKRKVKEEEKKFREKIIEDRMKSYVYLGGEK